MKLLRGGRIVATLGVIGSSALTLAACAARGPAPSQAILEARQRAAAADARPKCVNPGAVVDLAFVYGAAELNDDARARLDAVVAWTACTGGAQIAVTVDHEYHHRQPDKEKALLSNRQAVLREYLAQRLPAGVVLAEGAAPDAQRPLVTIRARGW